MPYFPGFGYGAAMAGAEVMPALLAERRYQDTMSLQQRGMVVNEEAQKATAGYYGAIEGDMAAKQRAAETNAAGTVMQYEVLGGTAAPENPPMAPGVPSQTPAAQNAPAGYPVPVATIPNNLPLPPSAVGAPRYGAEMLDQIKPGGQPSGVEAKNALTVEEKGAMPLGQPTRVHAVPGGRPQAGPVPAAGGATPSITGQGEGMTPAAQLAMSEGKTAVTPTEGNGMLKASTDLQSQAVAVKGRLDETLKMIDKQYSGDPTQATFRKANLIAKVSPQISQMNARAASLKNEGELANHVQVGSQLGSRIWSQISNGGVIDSSFVSANAPLIKSLGVQESDLHIFDGMHLSNGAHPGDSPLNKGWVVNRGGFIIPPKALWEAANFALPYAQRAQAWDEMTKMYHIQMDEKAKLITASNTSPSMLPAIAEENVKRVLGDYSTATRVRDHTYNVLTNGGSLMLPGPGGKMTSVTIPAPSMPVNGKKDPDAIMSDYKSRFFSQDKTLPAPIAAAISAHLDASASADKAIAVKNIWDHFSTKGVNVGGTKDPNEVKYEADIKETEAERLNRAKNPPKPLTTDRQ